MKLILTSLLIFIISYFAFTANITCFCTTDSIPNNLTAFNLLFNHRIDLTNIYPLIQKRGLVNITVVSTKSVVFSKTPPMLGILSTPTFYILNSYFGVKNLTPEQMLFSEYGQYVGKLSASFYTSLSAVLLFLLLIRIFQNYKASLIGTTVYVFGTNIFNTVSQANWQHGISLFLILIFLHLTIIKRVRSWQIIIAGLLISLLSVIRISNILYLIFPIILFWGKYYQSKATLLIAYFLAFLLGYLSLSGINQKIGVPPAYQGEIVQALSNITPFNIVGNLISILFSWNFGLFIFSPILLLVIPGIKKNTLYIALGAVVLLFLLFTSIWPYWTGGTSLEARMLSESIPIWIIFLTTGLIKFSRSKIFVSFFVLLFLASIFVNLLTTWAIDCSWYSYYMKQTPETQIHDAWYKNPTLLGYLISRKVIHWETIYKQGNKIMIHRVEFRPDIKNFIKIYTDKSYSIL